jgi:signal transduction histidine kinase
MYYSNQWGVNKEVKYFIINIERPWWASYWFYSIIAFVSIAFTFFGIRYFYTIKIKKQKKEMALTIHSIEAERKRISRDLHDGIGPKLSSIKLIGETLRHNPNNNLGEQLPNIIDETIVDIRYIINELSPHTLKQNGLFEALNSFINITSKRNFLDITFNSNNKEINVNDDIAINILRICQEGINNAIKYSECNNIKVDLIYLDQISIELCIKDNGKGFNYEEALKKGSGISNMHTRCDILNGEFKINTEIGKGTELKIFVPLSF